MGASNLLLLRNPHWRFIRSRLSPVFSSAKLKNIYYLLAEVGNNLNRYLMKINDESNESSTLNYKDLSERYTIDVIASCIFGVQANSIENPKSEFYDKGKTFNEFNFLRGIELTSFFILPELVPIFKFTVRYVLFFIIYCIWLKI